jgi:hypothetical protein
MDICLTPPDLDLPTRPRIYASAGTEELDGWWMLSTEGNDIVIHIREIANLPPVKAALAAMEKMLDVCTLFVHGDNCACEACEFAVLAAQEAQAALAAMEE